MRAMTRWFLLTIMILTPAVASAQAETDSNLFWDVTKAVVLDPTTYAPATLSYTSMKLDWNSFDTLVRRDLEWFATASPMSVLRSTAPNADALAQTLRTAWDYVAADEATDL